MFTVGLLGCWARCEKSILASPDPFYFYPRNSGHHPSGEIPGQASLPWRDTSKDHQLVEHHPSAVGDISKKDPGR